MFGVENRRVLVVTEGRLVAEALMFALDSDPAIDAIGYVVDVWDAFRLVSSYEPDVVVVGPGGRNLDQLHIIRLLHDFFPEVAQIAICAGRNQSDSAREAGAEECLPESCSADELLHAITSGHRSRRTRPRAGAGPHLRLLHAGHAHA